ncbi:hypothetical protein L2E65_13975 [Planktothrix agardhii 1801]|uniref:hypothetical protein n=1 Tax=Planktothrix agardhii TaxID=1160 RepID=UPI001F1F4AEC|nr:hypothetical protein [Planktothrix agardhii]MCF3623357.1 hypothetical protein [Planktothrix agardhii 1801]MCF3625897.1 hypothetical protein [Planktothrix agardhii 1801]
MLCPPLDDFCRCLELRRQRGGDGRSQARRGVPPRKPSVLRRRVAPPQWLTRVLRSSDVSGGWRIGAPSPG